MKTIVIYDLPWKVCDKKWLYEKLLEREQTVIQISPKNILYNIETKNRIGYFYVMWISFWMSFKAVLLAKPGDVIIGWKTLTGIFASILAPKNVRIISLNWLTPQSNDKLSFLRKLAIKNANFRIGVNCLETKKELIEAYSGEEGKTCLAERIFWIPDVPESDFSFSEIKEKQNKYCFTGGINNRDWKLIVNTAEQNRDMMFRCIAIEKYYRENVEQGYESENLEVFYNLEASEYYDMLKNSHIMVLPLKDQRVAGLINVIKAIEYGVLPLTSKNKAIEQYYPEDLRALLQFEIGNEKELTEKLNLLYNLSFDKYSEYICSLREHLSKKFNADRAIDCIMGVMKN